MALQLFKPSREHQKETAMENRKPLQIDNPDIEILHVTDAKADGNQITFNLNYGGNDLELICFLKEATGRNYSSAYLTDVKRDRVVGRVINWQGEDTRVQFHDAGVNMLLMKDIWAKVNYYVQLKRKRLSNFSLPSFNRMLAGK